MTRKRAPGGGRKPKGAAAMRSQVNVRMPEDMRAQLEAAARKRGRNVSEELLARLHASFAREHEHKRDPATRALIFLISRAAKYTGGDKRPNWHRDPFCFRAFRLAVAKLLEELEPQGEIRPPFEAGKDPSYFVKNLKTPDAFAEYVAALVLDRLESPMSLEDRSIYQQVIDSGEMKKNPIIAEIMDDAEREYYGMFNVRRALQRGQKKGD